MIAEIELSKEDVEFLSTLAENGWFWTFEVDDLKKAVKILQRIWLNISTEVVQ